jgi:hypothetical protein
MVPDGGLQTISLRVRGACLTRTPQGPCKAQAASRSKYRDDLAVEAEVEPWKFQGESLDRQAGYVVIAAGLTGIVRGTQVRRRLVATDWARCCSRCLVQKSGC